MTPEIFHCNIMPAAFNFLPASMNTLEAQAMLLAIAMQESDFTNRNQILGPANGYFQFELIGVRGTILHHRTGSLVRDVCKTFGYDNARQIHLAIEDNDLLAVILARYNLYSYPSALPGRLDHEEGWRQYLAVWRPGKPRIERWEERFKKAWQIVLGF